MTETYLQRVAFNLKFREVMRQVLFREVTRLTTISSFVEVDGKIGASFEYLVNNRILALTRIRTSTADNRNFPSRFTIRSKHRSRSPVELQMIYQGWGDLMLYCVASKDESQIATWMLLDLHKFRQEAPSKILEPKPSAFERDNERYNDGTSYMLNRADTFSKEFVLSKSFNWEN